MSAAPTTQHFSEVDPVLSAVLQALRTQATAESVARLQGNQAQWMMPVANGWKGSPFDYEGMAQPYSRAQSNAWFTKATANAAQSGSTGDLIATTTQVDYLACMERAFRARHTMSRPRAMCHTMGRKMGHGLDTGPLSRSIIEYIQGVNTQAKNQLNNQQSQQSAGEAGTGGTA